MKQRILVTGAGGSIGSHLVEMLVKNGYTVRAFVRYNSRNQWGWLESSKINQELELVSGDIRDYDIVYNACEDCKVIFHLAALIGIPYSYISPMSYIQTNIIGTYNVLEAARQRGAEQVLVTSTSETYGTAKYVPIDEKHPLVGQSPYSATKISADELALSYYLSFGLPVKIVRPFNVYGPRQSARAIIPSIVSQIIGGNKEIKVGNLNPSRDLTYVTDITNGFYHIFQSQDLFGEVTNIGMNKEITILNLILKISEIMGAEVSIAHEESRVRPENSEVLQLRCDNSKLISNTGWVPNYDLNKGLISTIEWIRANINFYKSNIYNV